MSTRARGETVSEEMHGKIEAARRGPLKRMSAHGFLRHGAEIDDGSQFDMRLISSAFARANHDRQRLTTQEGLR
jgi:hypothetical protein